MTTTRAGVGRRGVLPPPPAAAEVATAPCRLELHPDLKGGNGMEGRLSSGRLEDSWIFWVAS
jgi:hypothetical protein